MDWIWEEKSWSAETPETHLEYRNQIILNKILLRFLILLITLKILKQLYLLLDWRSKPQSHPLGFIFARWWRVPGLSSGLVDVERVVRAEAVQPHERRLLEPKAMVWSWGKKRRSQWPNVTSISSVINWQLEPLLPEDWGYLVRYRLEYREWMPIGNRWHADDSRRFQGFVGNWGRFQDRHEEHQEHGVPCSAGLDGRTGLKDLHCQCFFLAQIRSKPPPKSF